MIVPYYLGIYMLGVVIYTYTKQELFLESRESNQMVYQEQKQMKA